MIIVIRQALWREVPQKTSGDGVPHKIGFLWRQLEDNLFDYNGKVSHSLRVGNTHTDDSHTHMRGILG